MWAVKFEKYIYISPVLWEGDAMRNIPGKGFRDLFYLAEIRKDNNATDVSRNWRRGTGCFAQLAKINQKRLFSTPRGSRVGCHVIMCPSRRAGPLPEKASRFLWRTCNRIRRALSVSAGQLGK